MASSGLNPAGLCLFMLGVPELDAGLQVGVSPEQNREGRRIPSLELQATLLFLQPRTCLAFWAVSAHCQDMLSFLSTNNPKSFSSWPLLILTCPACVLLGVPPTHPPCVRAIICLAHLPVMCQSSSTLIHVISESFQNENICFYNNNFSNTNTGQDL